MNDPFSVRNSLQVLRVTQRAIMYSSDIHRSDSSSANADELKRIKSLVNDLQDELEESFAEHTEKFESIESMITDLQSRFSQMETHVGRYLKEMDYVSLKCFTSVTLLSKSNVR